MKDKKVEAAVKIQGHKADIIITDEVEPGVHKAVVKDVPKIIAEKPALISYSKSDFISTVAAMVASDDEWKLEDILPYAAEVCQAAGEYHNELVVAEQDRALKDAIEAESKFRYIRVEYMDGDIQYWATDIPRTLMSGIAFTDHAKTQARKLRPFMEIRYITQNDTVDVGEEHKYVRNLETSEVMHER